MGLLDSYDAKYRSIEEFLTMYRAFSRRDPRPQADRLPFCPVRRLSSAAIPHEGFTHESCCRLLSFSAAMTMRAAHGNDRARQCPRPGTT